MLGESWDGGCDFKASSRAAGDMIYTWALRRAPHSWTRTALADRRRLAMADEDWDPSSDMPGAQQARLAVMSADGASVRQWGSRSRVACTQSAGRCSRFRASGRRQRPAAALPPVRQQGGRRKRAREDRGE